MKQFSEQELVRRNKVNENTSKGIKSYLKKQPISHLISEILVQYQVFSKEELENKQIKVTT